MSAGTGEEADDGAFSDPDAPTLGVCYYPEHWPESEWASDARRMADLGLAHVRIGEFAWSRIEPAPGRIELDWLERAADTLGAAGLRVVLGTPTACPPKWLVDAMPDMVALDETGRPRGFGSRRHYDFSHSGFLEQARRITRIVAGRLGRHEAVAAWQTDNEYGCHDTVRSFSPAALKGFRAWLERRYGTIDALNAAWGNVFWSMEYRGFDEIELPNLTVTEANPAHRMAFARYSSAMVSRFDAAQRRILRELSPGRAILHNFMGRVTEFDHFALFEPEDGGGDGDGEAADGLDIATWDSYPLGFLEDRSDRPAGFRARFLRAGDPDFQAMHHDLYRAVGRGRWWVMEQQPGPVNWAGYNPIPAHGMVRVWTWEAFAHGAECVSYFRWRQAPFAQEQMHAGLLRPDGVEAAGHQEAERVACELRALAKSHVAMGRPAPAPVAIVFDYESAWAWHIQPQGRGFDYVRLVFEVYRAARSLGQDVDFLSPRETDWSAHRVVLVPGLFAWTPEARAAMEAFGGEVVVGPRTGSKTAEFSIPPALPPDAPALGVTVRRAESLPEHALVPCEGGGALRLWVEDAALDGATAEIVRTDSRYEWRAEGGPVATPAVARAGRRRTVLGWPDDVLMRRVLSRALGDAGLATLDLPDAVRVRSRGDLRIVTNYGEEPVSLEEIGLGGRRVLGDGTLRGHGVAILAR